MDYSSIVEFWKSKEIKTANELSAILDSFSVNFAYNSGKIENEKVTYHDTREIFTNDGVTAYTGDLRTLFEIRNAKTAYEAILQAFETRQPITEELVKHVQRLLTENTYDTRRYQLGERPGEYKLGDYIVGEKEVGALAEDVPEEMRELLEELDGVDAEHALTAAAYFHAKFENIHPFSDGNGRTGRLLMNYILLIHDHPPISIHEEDRKEYYDALDRYDNDLELDALVEHLKCQLEKTWAGYIDRRAREDVQKHTLDAALASSADEAPVATKASPRPKHGGKDTR